MEDNLANESLGKVFKFDSQSIDMVNYRKFHRFVKEHPRKQIVLARKVGDGVKKVIYNPSMNTRGRIGYNSRDGAEEGFVHPQEIVHYEAL